ncbi:hypothetical protein CAPTEDRAFT_210845 [Capitella teleta]|uniref:Uncharacterized protein n=1 Tax=Capitella teleta TaxID=283909 RepID=R7U1M2_CAPTE|nr:hypothetical protein CAPTEDRAFT_210845 [Capitella teleta]|eukprot:ELT99859.1 hypothetical protein CAPTEDRAFT_210845 [Capitella teleta]
MKGFWINLWSFLFVSNVASISDTWSVGDIMGRLDSKGMLAFWRDFSISSDLPDPSDDFDRILIQIEEFQLIKPDGTRIDLLQASDEQISVFEPDSWNFNFNDISGVGKSLKINTAHFREKLAVFLYIFSENGTIFRESKLQVKLHSQDAFLGLKFPRFLVSPEVQASCNSGRCRLEVSFGIKSQMLSRSMRNTGKQGAIENLVAFDFNIGQSSKMTLTNKVRPVQGREALVSLHSSRTICREEEFPVHCVDVISITLG